MLCLRVCDALSRWKSRRSAELLSKSLRACYAVFFGQRYWTQKCNFRFGQRWLKHTKNTIRYVITFFFSQTMAFLSEKKRGRFAPNLQAWIHPFVSSFSLCHIDQWFVRNRSRSSLNNNREQLDKQHPAFVMRSLFTNLNTHILKSLYIIEIHYLYSIFPDIIFLKTHSCKPRYWKMPRETLIFLICINGFICFFVHPAPFILFILIALGLVVGFWCAWACSASTAVLLLGN